MSQKITEIISSEPFTNSYGSDMISYKITLEEFGDREVKLNQLAKTPAPYIGQVLDGEVDWTDKYGPKFNKTKPGYNQAPMPFRNTPQSPERPSGARSGPDPHYMALAYAKDILVALIASGNTDVKKMSYKELLQFTRIGADVLEGKEEPTESKPTMSDDFLKQTFPGAEVITKGE